MRDAMNCDAGFYHLTGKGWIRKDSDPFPEDRYETWQYEEERPAGDAKDRIHLTRIWRRANTTEAALEALHARFGEAVAPDADRHLTLDCLC